MPIIPYDTCVLQRHRHAKIRRSSHSQYLTQTDQVYSSSLVSIGSSANLAPFLACWIGSTGNKEPYLFRLSSSISLYVLQLKSRKAAIMRSPPTIAAGERGSPVRNQSTIATRKIVRLGSVSGYLRRLIRIGNQESLQRSYGGEHRRSERDEYEEGARKSYHAISIRYP